jgi:hypothetical protein
MSGYGSIGYKEATERMRRSARVWLEAESGLSDDEKGGYESLRYLSMAQACFCAWRGLFCGQIPVSDYESFCEFVGLSLDFECRKITLDFYCVRDELVV